MGRARFLVLGRSGGDWLRFVLFLLLVTGTTSYVLARMPGFLNSRPPAAVPALSPAGAQATKPTAAPVGTADAPAGSTAAQASSRAEAVRDFFAEFRVQRDRARGREQEMLRELMDRADTVESLRQQVQSRYLELSQKVALEEELEGLILARGYSEAAVWLGDKAAQVILGSRQLTPAQAAQVAELVGRTAGVDPTGIQIVTRDP